MLHWINFLTSFDGAGKTIGLTKTQVIHEVCAEDSRLAEREEGLVCNGDVKISLRRDLMSIGKHHDDSCGRPKILPSG